MNVGDRFWRGLRVCVTGGTGFLGCHLIEQLLARRALVRSLSLPATPDHPLNKLTGVERFEGDVRDRELVRRALADCQVVFHTAGIVAVWGPALERMWSVHIEGTQNVLAAAERGARIVHTSSVVAVGASRRARELTEEDLFNLTNIDLPYCHAKRAAEELALNTIGNRDVVVVNPAYLVGPSDYEGSIMGRFCLRFWRGRVPLAPPGGVNLVDVRDVALGHLLAAELGRRGQRYILAGENRTYTAFMCDLAAAAGWPRRWRPTVPCWMLTLVAGMNELRARFTGREPYPSLAHARVSRYRWFYRSDKAAEELGYRPRPLAETLRDTFSWFAGEGKLPLAA